MDLCCIALYCTAYVSRTICKVMNIKLPIVSVTNSILCTYSQALKVSMQLGGSVVKMGLETHHVMLTLIHSAITILKPIYS